MYDHPMTKTDAEALDLTPQALDQWADELGRFGPNDNTAKRWAEMARALAAEKRAAVPVDAEREELAKWCLVPRDLEHALMEWVGAIITDTPEQWKIDIAFGRLRQGITGYIQAVADGRATQVNATLLRTPAQAPDDAMVERAAREIAKHINTMKPYPMNVDKVWPVYAGEARAALLAARQGEK